MQAKGFLLGGTAGRTTLAGEGLQHQDGESLIAANTIPNCVTYDPTYAYELTVIILDGMRRMYKDMESVFYYITVMNETYQQPEMPKGAEQGIIKGIYHLKTIGKHKNEVQLLGSGTILREVELAAQILDDDWGVSSKVWSVTSFNELTKEAQAVERENRFMTKGKPKKPYISECLEGSKGPIIAATDYIKNYAEQVRKYIPGRYEVLGTDGFGRSDSRAALREFFEVNANYIVVTSLRSLSEEGLIDKSQVTKALKKYKISNNKPNPLSV